MKKLLLLILVFGLGLMPVLASTATRTTNVSSAMYEADDDDDDDDEDDNDEPKPYTHHEFTVGYGLLPSTSVRDFWKSSPYIREHDHVGSILLTYTYRFNQVVGLGATFAFDPANCTYSDQRRPELGDICKLKHYNYTAMVHLKINWLNTRVVAMYSKVSMGATFGKPTLENYYPDLYEASFTGRQSFARFAYNIAPVGIELGNRQYAAFMQCGYGAEGIFCIGFRYGFGFNKNDR